MPFSLFYIFVWTDFVDLTSAVLHLGRVFTCVLVVDMTMKIQLLTDSFREVLFQYGVYSKRCCF